MCVPTPEVALKRSVYRYEFRPAVSLKDIEETLFLALTAAEGVHGEARVRLEGALGLCKDHRTVSIDASTAVGEDLARIFTQLVTAQFGEDSFTVERVADGPGAPPEAAETAGVGR
jgi:hypothetical protein